MARAVQSRAKKARFPSKIDKPDTRWAGRTDVAATPLHMRTIGPDLDEATRRWVQDRAERRLGKYAPHIERLSFRFEDVNGPRGGQDIV
ncbi:MAG: hypothetical protein RL701_5224, partial [Pseudomonadota bacterium]